MDVVDPCLPINRVHLAQNNTYVHVYVTASPSLEADIDIFPCEFGFGSDSRQLWGLVDY